MAYRIQTLQVILACMKELQIFAYESTRKGDYHRKLDPNWSYTPTYLRKMHHIRRFLSGLPKETRIIIRCRLWRKCSGRVALSLQTCNLSPSRKVSLVAQLIGVGIFCCSIPVNVEPVLVLKIAVKQEVLLEKTNIIERWLNRVQCEFE